MEVLANITVRGQNQRFRLAAVLLALALGLSVAVVESDVGRGWRFLLFLPFWMTAVGAFQGLYRTCVKRASLGERETDAGTERIADRIEVDYFHRRGQKVWLHATIAAALATLVIVLVP